MSAGIRIVAPPNGRIPRLISICPNRAVSAASRISPASISSIPIVRQYPCTATTSGFDLRRGPSPSGSTSPSGKNGAPFATAGPTSFSSSPPVKCSPSAYRSAHHTSESSS
ncbi:MAG: hypothetical protein R3B70_13290 [Polyangiaceae bacterium]